MIFFLLYSKVITPEEFAEIHTPEGIKSHNSLYLDDIKDTKKKDLTQKSKRTNIVINESNHTTSSSSFIRDKKAPNCKNSTSTNILLGEKDKEPDTPATTSTHSPIIETQAFQSSPQKDLHESSTQSDLYTQKSTAAQTDSDAIIYHHQTTQYPEDDTEEEDDDDDFDQFSPRIYVTPPPCSRNNTRRLSTASGISEQTEPPDDSQTSSPLENNESITAPLNSGSSPHHRRQSNVSLSTASPPSSPGEERTQSFTARENTAIFKDQDFSLSSPPPPQASDISEKPRVKRFLSFSARARTEPVEDTPFIISTLSTEEITEITEYLTKESFNEKLLEEYLEQHPLLKEMLGKYSLLKKMLDRHLKETDFKSAFGNIDKMVTLTPFIKLFLTLCQTERDDFKKEKYIQILSIVQKIILDKASRGKIEYLKLFIEILEYSEDSIPLQIYRISLIEDPEEKQRYIKILKKSIQRLILKKGFKLTNGSAQKEYTYMLTQPYENFKYIHSYLSKENYNEVIRILHPSLWHSNIESVTRKSIFKKVNHYITAKPFIETIFSSSNRIAVFNCAHCLPPHTQEASFDETTTLGTQHLEDGLLNSDNCYHVDIPPNGYIFTHTVKFNKRDSLATFDVILTATPESFSEDTLKNEIEKAIQIAINHGIKILVIGVWNHQGLKATDFQKDKHPFLFLQDLSRLYGGDFDRIVFADNLLEPKK